MPIPEPLSELLEEYASLSDVKDKFSFLLELADELPPLAESDKTPENKITGCASNAWVKTEIQDGKIFVFGDADGQISKGVIAFLALGLSSARPEQILSLPKELLAERGLLASLSPSRSNGALSMLRKIQEDAKRFSL